MDLQNVFAFFFDHGFENSVTISFGKTVLGILIEGNALSPWADKVCMLNFSAINYIRLS